MTPDQFRRLLLDELPALLEAEPSLRGELSRLLGIGEPPAGASARTLWEALTELTDRVNELAALVKELVAAQVRTDERLARLEEGQQRLEANYQRLEANFQRLEEGQQRLEANYQRLEEGQQRLEGRVQRLEDHVGALRGDNVERRYRDQAGSYFGRLLGRVQVVNISHYNELLAAKLDPDQREEVYLLDLLLAGKLPDGSDAWLAVELSAVVDADDVERAARRAALLRRLGWKVVAAAAGGSVTDGARAGAAKYSVALLQDGRVEGWEAALASAA